MPHCSTSARSLAGLALAACASIPPGHAGVLLTPSGVASDSLGEGFHTVGPWSQVDDYDLRAQIHDADLFALSADGEQLEARASVLTFHIVPEEVVALARGVGPDYYTNLVEPVVSATVRRVLAAYRLDELDTPGVLRAQAEIVRMASARLRPYHLVLDEILLRRVSLPVSSAAYQAVLATGTEEQVALTAPQQLDVARRRADARREEARGIAAGHQAIAASLTPLVLADAARRAWLQLLTAPTSTTFVGADSTILEVNP